MQKTRIAAALALGLTSTATQADSFDGFYAGASLAKAEAEYEVSVPDTQFSQDLDADSVNSFGLLAGFGKRFGQWYLGGELDWRDSLGEASATVANGEFAVETDSSLGLSILPGYAVTDNLLIFTRLAYLEGDTDLTLTNLNNGASLTVSDSGTYTGWGLGGEYAFNENLSVRAEYREFDGDDQDYFIDVPLELEAKDINSLALSVVYSF